MIQDLILYTFASVGAAVSGMGLAIGLVMLGEKWRRKGGDTVAKKKGGKGCK